MTGPDEDLDAVRRLMQEAGLEDGDALTPVLMDMRRFRHHSAPVPSPAVAALMTGRGRRRATRTGVVVALAVTVSLGAGLSAAAASPAVRDTAAQAVAALGSPTVHRPSLPRVEGSPAARPVSGEASSDGARARTLATRAPATAASTASPPSPRPSTPHARPDARSSERPAASPAGTPAASPSHGEGSSGQGRSTSPSHHDGKDGITGKAGKQSGSPTPETVAETRG